MMVRPEKAGKRRRKLRKGRSLGKERWLVLGQRINLTQAKRRKKAGEIEWREITNEEEMLEWRQKEDGKKNNRQKKRGGDRNLKMDRRQVTNVPTYILFVLYLQPRRVSLNLIRRHPCKIPPSSSFSHFSITAPVFTSFLLTLCLHTDVELSCFLSRLCRLQYS